MQAKACLTVHVERVDDFTRPGVVGGELEVLLPAVVAVLLGHVSVRTRA